MLQIKEIAQRDPELGRCDFTSKIFDLESKNQNLQTQLKVVEKERDDLNNELIVLSARSHGLIKLLHHEILLIGIAVIKLVENFMLF